MPMWHLLALATGLWLVVLPGLAAVAGYRWPVKPRVTPAPSDFPATPEEGTHA